MKHFFSAYFSKVVLLFFLSTSSTLAVLKEEVPGAKRVGAGVSIGAPMALTVKYWVTPDHALDAGISYFFGDYFLFYGDYLWHHPGLFGVDSKFVRQLLPYIGLGASLYTWEGRGTRPFGAKSGEKGVGFYGRVPLGVEWYPHSPPIGVFLELAPGIRLVPNLWLEIDGGVGIRYYF